MPLVSRGLLVTDHAGSAADSASLAALLLADFADLPPDEAPLTRAFFVLGSS
jgi:hypothetical protein